VIKGSVLKRWHQVFSVIVHDELHDDAVQIEFKTFLASSPTLQQNKLGFALVKLKHANLFFASKARNLQWQTLTQAPSLAHQPCFNQRDSSIHKESSAI
jgi:hypothetical protein